MSIRHPVMRYHGGKFRLAPWVMSFFPPHSRYIEPYGGAAGILMRKPRVPGEVYNDLDGDVVNVFRVLRDPESASRLQDLLELTPYARDEFDLAYEAVDDQIERARRTLILANMGFGSAGATKGATGFRVDSRRSYGTASHVWSKYPPQISSFCARLQGVIIENRPAIRVMDGHDGADALMLIDPPYLPEMRSFHRTSGKFYRHEMTEADHIELLHYLQTLRSSVVLCGYPSDLYMDNLSSWTLHTTDARISSSRGTTTKKECVWLNSRCVETRRQQRLIA